MNMNKNDQIIEWDKIEEKVHMLKDMNEEEKKNQVNELASCLCLGDSFSESSPETPFLEEVINRVRGWCQKNKKSIPKRESYASIVWLALCDHITQYDPSEDESLEHYLVKKCVDEMIESLKSDSGSKINSLDAPTGSKDNKNGNEGDRTLMDTIADPNAVDPAEVCCAEPSEPVESPIKANAGFLEKYFSLEDRTLIELLNNIVNRDTETNAKKKNAELTSFVRIKLNKELMTAIEKLSAGNNRNKGENIILNDLGHELCSAMKTLGHEDSSHPDYTPVYIRSCLFRISRRMLKIKEQFISRSSL